MTERPRIAVLDYGAGNLVSILHALARVGADPVVADRATEVQGAAAVVVPGVGASGPAMRTLRRRGLARALESAVAGGACYLGVCLGMQLLFEVSDEDGASGLGWLRGRVSLLPGAPRLPHVGWNTVEPVADRAAAGSLFPGGASEPFYFVHSYAPVPDRDQLVIARTTHGGSFASAVATGPIVGVQFHPEKSGASGLAFLSRWLDAVSTRGTSPLPAAEG